MEKLTIRLTTLRPEVEIPISIYIFFKEQYLVYIKPGDIIPKDKFKKLRKQKISKYFILAEDEKNYQNFLDQLLESTMSSDSVKTDEKVELIQGAAGQSLNDFQASKGSEQSFNQTKKVAENLEKLINSGPEALLEIFSNQSEPSPIIQHNFNVSALCSKLGKLFKLADDKINTLSTAAMLHDMGLMFCDEDIQSLQSKDKKEFSPDEQKKYNSHVESSLELIADKPYASADIIRLIKFHEENLSGTGPHKKAKLEVDEQILSLCNKFDQVITQSSLSPEEALKKISLDFIGDYDLEMIKTMKKIFK